MLSMNKVFYAFRIRTLSQVASKQVWREGQPRLRWMASLQSATPRASLTMFQLKQELKERGLKVSGNKSELIIRLENAEDAGPNVQPNPAGVEEEVVEGGVTPIISVHDQPKLVDKLSRQVSLEAWRVKNAVELFEGGSTLPFIARYRKELTGGMDETELRKLETALDMVKKVEHRRKSIITSLKRLNKWNNDIDKNFTSKFENIDVTLKELEDLYLPFKPNRLSKALVARNLGLQPLADMFMLKNSTPNDFVHSSILPIQSYDSDVYKVVDVFKTRVVQKESSVAGSQEETNSIQELSSEAIMKHVRDIIAEELFVENPEIKATARKLLLEGCVVKVSEKSEGCDVNEKYRVYHKFEQPYQKLSAYQILAINRGVNSNVLSVKYEFSEDAKQRLLQKLAGEYEMIYLMTQEDKANHLRSQQPFQQSNENTCKRNMHLSWLKEFKTAFGDGFNRYLVPSLTREYKSELIEMAENDAFDVFTKNLRQKLLQPPIKNEVILGIDPGIRTGHKLAVISSTGAVVETGTLKSPSLFRKNSYRDGEDETSVNNHMKAVANTIRSLLIQHRVRVVAIGNGKGSQEVEKLVCRALRHMQDSGHGNEAKAIKYTIVDESGASVYSASKLAALEFPQYDVSIRGAISIGRRIQDPLAELVKIDPKAIGVGMYQHDVNQKLLSQKLDSVIQSAVTSVGVDLNTASPHLLAHVSGLSKKTASAIIEARDSLSLESRNVEKPTMVTSGSFQGRFDAVEDIKRVKGIGSKVFEQAAGFLRVYGGRESLDTTTIHPEVYPQVRVAQSKLKEWEKTRKTLGNSSVYPEQYIASLSQDIGIGTYTLRDALDALNRDVNLDPRSDLLGVPPPLMYDMESSNFSDKIVASLSSEHHQVTLRIGEERRGVVKNVLQFGAFIDLGRGQDGLLHVSKFPRVASVRDRLLVVGNPVQVQVSNIEQVGGKERVSLKLVTDSPITPRLRK